MFFLSVGSVGDSLFIFYSNRVRRVEKLKKTSSNCPRMPLHFQESMHARGNKQKQEKLTQERKKTRRSKVGQLGGSKLQLVMLRVGYIVGQSKSNGRLTRV